MARSTPKLNPQLQLFHEMFARHPMLLAFAIEGVHRYAEQILAMDKAQWPEGHFVTFELWQSLAAQAKEILK